MLAYNSDWCDDAFLAAWWAGPAAYPINMRWSEAEMLHALRDGNDPLLLADEAFARRAQILARQLPALRAPRRCWRMGITTHDVQRGGSELAAIL